MQHIFDNIGMYTKSGFMILFFIILTLPLFGQRLPRVLVLDSYNKGFSWTDYIDEGIINRFAESYPDVDIQFEHMDTRRYTLARIESYLVSLYREKYLNNPPSVIISSDDNAFAFLLRHRDDLFPGIPIVFCGVNDFNPETIAGHPLITGISESYDLVENLKLVRKLFPDTQHLAVISDITETGIFNSARMRRAVEEAKPDYEIIYLEKLTRSELESSLAHLPPDTIVFNLCFWRDADNIAYNLQESLSLVSTASPVPVMTTWDFMVEYGILGGYCIDGNAQGDAAASYAIRILNGEHPADLPVVMKGLNTYTFDHQVLEKFHIKNSQLPLQSRIFNLPDQNFERLILIVFSVAGIAGILGALVFALLLVIGRLKSVQASLRSIYNAVPDGIVLTDPNGLILDANPAFWQMHGYSDPVMKKSLYDFSESANEPYTRIEDQSSSHFESIHIKGDGSRFPVEVNAVKINTRNENQLLAVFRDVFERKKQEQLLKTSLHDKSILLQEIHHRVKNNLQIIASLVNLQSASFEDEEIHAAFEETRNRVYAMALIHEMIYTGSDLGKVEIINYLRDLANYLLQALMPKNQISIIHEANVGTAYLNIDAAIPIGLISNEIITNAIKYAFDDAHKGSITIRIDLLEDQSLVLSITDSGKGLSDSIVPNKTESLGMTIVHSLTRQLCGTCAFESPPGSGLKFSLSVPRTALLEFEAGCDE